jgi:hypothetical protein
MWDLMCCKLKVNDLHEDISVSRKESPFCYANEDLNGHFRGEKSTYNEETKFTFVKHDTY